MAIKVSKLHQQCHRLWVLAFKEPQTLSFGTAKETERAKFTLYDAVRKAKREGVGSPELVEAALNCEICLAPDKLSLTLQNRSENQFYGTMLDQLDIAVGGAEPERVDRFELEAAESLNKLKGLQGREEVPETEPNPYYKRG